MHTNKHKQADRQTGRRTGGQRDGLRKYVGNNLKKTKEVTIFACSWMHAFCASQAFVSKFHPHSSLPTSLLRPVWLFGWSLPGQKTLRQQQPKTLDKRQQQCKILLVAFAGQQTGLAARERENKQGTREGGKRMHRRSRLCRLPAALFCTYSAFANGICISFRPLSFSASLLVLCCTVLYVVRCCAS